LFSLDLIGAGPRPVARVIAGLSLLSQTGLRFINLRVPTPIVQYFICLDFFAF
jgi:hypothetical protein